MLCRGLHVCEWCVQTVWEVLKYGFICSSSLSKSLTLPHALLCYSGVTGSKDEVGFWGGEGGSWTGNEVDSCSGWGFGQSQLWKNAGWGELMLWVVGENPCNERARWIHLQLQLLQPWILGWVSVRGSLDWCSMPSSLGASVPCNQARNIVGPENKE